MALSTESIDKEISDSWLKSIVWYTSYDGTWKLGEIIGREKENDTSTFTLIGKNYHNVDMLQQIKTKALDKHDFEFEHVKRHDRDPFIHEKTLDMTTLICLNEPEMIECLRRRYCRENIYTKVGPILIAVNPFKSLPIYSAKSMSEYCNEGFKRPLTASLAKGNDIALPPHIFQTGNSAYHDMFIDPLDTNKRENQVIIVHGESGAGKTASVRFIMDFLAMVSVQRAELMHIQSYEKQSGDQVVASNPIIESFGNAKTTRNNNSSRFGKFIEVCYDKHGLISGAVIRSYLLETLRVTTQAAGERNFHIFYEVCNAESPYRSRLLATLNQETAQPTNNVLELFRYTNQSGEYHRNDSFTDKQNFQDLQQAMSVCLINESEQNSIFEVVISLLHLGNITLTSIEHIGHDTVEFAATNQLHVKEACQLLGVEPELLLYTIYRRKMVVVGVEIEKRLTCAVASHALDAFAQYIFLSLFQWIIKRINSTLTIPSSCAMKSFIGILDIFGFEYFLQNSFEQLCINYTNEKLQYHFNFTIFHMEKEIYIQEDLDWTIVDFPDNSMRLDLLEHRVIGLFALCDEQLKMPHATDDRLAKSYYEKCSSHQFFFADKSQQKRNEFTVKHFARDVTYQVHGFLDKNRGNIVPEFLTCLEKSSIPLVQELAQFDPWKPVEHVGDNTSSTPVTPSRIPQFAKSSSLQYETPSPPNRHSIAITKEHQSLSHIQEKSASEKAYSPSRLVSSNIPKYQSQRLTSSPKDPDKLPSYTSVRNISVRRTTSSISATFSQQLNALMLKINNTKAHFVRCIKPNVDLAANHFDQLTVLHQLRCGGTLAAIQVFRAGFSTRITISEFVLRFQCFTFVSGESDAVHQYRVLLEEARQTNSNSHWGAVFRQLFALLPLIIPIINAVESTKLPPYVTFSDGLMVGKTRVFLRPHCNEHLELIRFYVGSLAARVIQFHLRNFVRKRKGQPPRLRHYMSSVGKSFMFGKHAYALRMMNACVFLQQRTRVFIQQCRLYYAVRAASKIAAFRHGCLTRRLLCRMKIAAILIQSNIRAHQAKKAFIKSMSMLVLIQVRMRVWLKIVRKRREERLKRLEIAIPKLQAHVRGVRTRQFFKTVVNSRVVLSVKRLSEDRSREAILLRFVRHHQRHVRRIRNENQPNQGQPSSLDSPSESSSTGDDNQEQSDDLQSDDLSTTTGETVPSDSMSSPDVSNEKEAEEPKVIHTSTSSQVDMSQINENRGQTNIETKQTVRSSISRYFSCCR